MDQHAIPAGADSPAAQALSRLIEQETSRGAEEGLACDIASSLLHEFKEAATPVDANRLPPLKRAILAYAIEQAAQQDAD